MWPPHFLVLSLLTQLSAIAWTFVQPTFASHYMFCFGLSSLVLLGFGLWGELHHLRTKTMPANVRDKSYSFLAGYSAVILAGWIYFTVGFVVGSLTK